MAQKFDVIVIGAGYAGLAAAALLSSEGRKVLLLERSSQIGGRASYYEEEGFIWEYGQHSYRLEEDGIAAKLMDKLGRPLEFIDSYKSDSFLYMNGKMYPRPEGTLAFFLTELMSFRARLDFVRFYSRLLSSNPADWYDKTLLDLYRAGNRNTEVEKFLPFIGLTVMLPQPTIVSAGEVIHFLKRAVKARIKQGELKGGSKQILDKLRDKFLESGGTLLLNQPVSEIVTENRVAVGVRSLEEEYRTDAVICAFPLFNLFEIIDQKLFAPEFVDYANNIQSSSGVSIDFVFNEPPAKIRGSILGIDLPLWVKFQTNSDLSIAPPGKHVTTWGLLMPPDVPLTQETADVAEGKIKSVMEELFPGILKNIVRQRRIVAPVINGNMLTVAQSYPHRPDVVSEDVNHLYFIGDTTRGEGCSGDIAFSSAMRLVERLS